MILIVNKMDELVFKKDVKKRKQPMKVGEALYHVIRQASVQGRLRRGILDCSQMLHGSCDQVMLCVTQRNTTPNQRHQHTLIEAFCRERGVKLVNVDNCKALVDQVAAQRSEQEGCTNCSVTCSFSTLSPSTRKHEKSSRENTSPMPPQDLSAENAITLKNGEEDEHLTGNGDCKRTSDSSNGRTGCCLDPHAEGLDDSCLLVSMPAILSEEDEFVLAFHDIAMCYSCVTVPFVKLYG